MRYMSTQQIRETWIKFFQEKHHQLVASASLIPNDDPTLLWINAGVAPLKKYFDGTEVPQAKRMVNIQKCLRTNDIEHVGLTARHHTFFEMMGNFSIGDYFKETAIAYGFELLTSPKYFGFDQAKLYITYYPDDLVTYQTWINLGIKKSHLIPMKSNFWDIGPGPCGPDTEIFYDRGQKYDTRGVKLIKEDLENDRFIEIWNIVFSQYNSEEGLLPHQYAELPFKNIDTGAGLERFACIMQNVETNFETDLFMPIMQELERITNVKYHGQTEFKVIADHIRTLVFAIADGANLSNEGRGYVLRRILRRAVKKGRDLKIKEPFLARLVKPVITSMQDFYPNLVEHQTIIEKIINKENVRFLETLADGEKHFQNSILDHKISGQNAFMLYDTYGFPIELTQELAREHQVEVDLEGFKTAMNEQVNRSKQARSSLTSMKQQESLYLDFKTPSRFIGYDQTQAKGCVIKVFEQGIVVDQTPFYASMGGQIHDQGVINDISVNDVIKLPNGQFLHLLDAANFEEGDQVTMIVNQANRQLIKKNHTATHLLHQALKDVFGSHVIQQGSSVNAERLTFDFNHFDKVTKEDIIKVEQIVNHKIKEQLKVTTHVLPLEEAKKLGAMMLFDETYESIVRVVDIQGYSLEFCGGLHVSNTKEIELFVITSLESIGSGIYRVEAITNRKTTYLNHLQEQYHQLITKANHLRIDQLTPLPTLTHSYLDLINYQNRLESIRELIKVYEKENSQRIMTEYLAKVNDLIPAKINPTTFVYLKDYPAFVLKTLLDHLYDKIKTQNVVLINEEGNKATILVKSLTNQANQVLRDILNQTDGYGGGKDTFAQGGVNNLAKLKSYLEDKL